jgi:hypothetical protein
MSEEILLNETILSAKLTNSQRGQLAELAFMRKAASLGFSVSKPWQEGERYDVIVRVNEVFWRVQVKSVLAKSHSRNHYRIRTHGGGRCRLTPYSASEIDFLAAYIFPEDLWYLFPISVIEHRNWSASGRDRSGLHTRIIARLGNSCDNQLPRPPQPQ